MASIEIPKEVENELVEAVSMIFSYTENAKEKDDKGELITLTKEQFFQKCIMAVLQNWLIQYRSQNAAKLVQQQTMEETKDIFRITKSISK